ncbi:DUF262 domain-containing protein [Sandarakinorhabdus sp. AAP62]|uniref:DUF262 domain-containing protein n=1 Tax=Sandarakinorhabdus sp. AAP62 TaxID=1248916 RepID=UPI0003791034|nr:DUF262 domain-containing protein [Sandarakinorhabdus sp. AAP62]
MKPYTRSVIELFDDKRRYLIPLYQRQYAWMVEPQLRLLWEDIVRAYRRLVADRAGLAPHFMGAMVIAQIKTFGREVKAFEVIDGQQRLTTFQLLLAALRDVAKANGSPYAEELRKFLLNDGIMESPSRERYKVWPSLLDRRAFVSVVDPAADLSTVAKPGADAEGHVRKAILAHQWFRSQIEVFVGTGDDYREDVLERLFEALKEGLAVVTIELESGDDAQTIFETLNSRGVDLTPGDLMRNFIFQRAKGLGQTDASLNIDTLYEQHWQPLDSSFWQEQSFRGRIAAQRLDWMLIDHLSMNKAEIVSKDNLFEAYRRWIADKQPFETVGDELSAISASAAIVRRILEQDEDDVVGEFGRFAEAFDVSTAFPLVVYLATEANLGTRLGDALAILESYILRRDNCGLTTANYNKVFVGAIDRLRLADGCKVEALFDWLSSKTSPTDRWPSDDELRLGWLGRDQYKSNRAPRLRYILEHIEQAKRTALSEQIEFRNTLSVEHIMPQKWRTYWPVPGFDHLAADEFDYEKSVAEARREACINKIGNLTLVTTPLNSTVSNGPFTEKLLALRVHSSLKLNRELNDFHQWDELTVEARGAALFEVAKKIWLAPRQATRAFPELGLPADNGGMPREGTICAFTYSGRTYTGRIEGRSLCVEGYNQPFSSFSAASLGITGTSRNGWRDWHLLAPNGAWVLSDEWRAHSSLNLPTETGSK